MTVLSDSQGYLLKLLNSFNGHLKKINPKDEFINIGLEVLRRRILRREKKGVGWGKGQLWRYV